MRTGRRGFLAAATAPVTAIGLAGCLGGQESAAGDDVIDTYDVAGSPGGPVAVRPDDRIALLDFWATWCPPCKPQMPELRDVHARFPDLHMLAVTNETDGEAIRSFWREYDGEWPVASDPELRLNDRFDVTRIPTLLVIDPAGREAWRHSGLASADSIAAALRDAGA